MTRRFSLGGYEAGVLWKFLDGISSAVSQRMVQGSTPGEENLTFLLCELLDANTTSLHALSYSLAHAKADLEKSDAGLTVDIAFETHEHSKHVESKYSGADLGIVLAVDHPVLGRSRRGILVQAKRLFGTGPQREYGLYSAYNSFDRKQADFLKTLASRFQAWNSVYYLWYNPPSTSFREADAKILRAHEAMVLGGSWHGKHPFVDEMMEMGGLTWSFGGRSPRIEATPDDEAAARLWRATQPALRVSPLDVASAVGQHGRPQLKALYDARLERRHEPAFSPFADFLLLALASSRYGSEGPDWLRLTEGQRVSMPKEKSPETPRTDIDDLESLPTPRHTLSVTLRSTLPAVG